MFKAYRFVQFLLSACCGAMLWSAVAVAEPPQPDPALDPAREAFAAGDFAKAADEARKIDSAVAAAFAARAALAQGDFVVSPSDRRAVFIAAEEDARRALARDPDSTEGHLCLALALGFLGRIDGSMTAHFAGYATEARTHIDRAIALAPESAWGHALDGGWNLEIVRDGGMLGETIYGASFEKGVAAYRRSLRLDPANAAIAYQFALQLLGAGGVINRAEALAVLVHALRQAPSDVVDTYVHRRIKRLKLTLDIDDERALKEILRDGLGIGSGTSDAARQKLLPGRAR
tara:strand:+ start:16650 stop:17516 length:867 start_codon:yes stop_codon:yes gene_type:complete